MTRSASPAGPIMRRCSHWCWHGAACEPILVLWLRSAEKESSIVWVIVKLYARTWSDNDSTAPTPRVNRKMKAPWI